MCFLHYLLQTAIRHKKSLARGEEVEFTITEGRKGPMATDVTGPNERPVKGYVLMYTAVHEALIVNSITPRN